MVSAQYLGVMVDLSSMKGYGEQSDTADGEVLLGLEAWEGPAILLVDLDAFFASVEQLDHVFLFIG